MSSRRERIFQTEIRGTPLEKHSANQGITRKIIAGWRRLERKQPGWVSRVVERRQARRARKREKRRQEAAIVNQAKERIQEGIGGPSDAARVLAHVLGKRHNGRQIVIRLGAAGSALHERQKR